MFCFDDLHLQIIQSVSTLLHWVKSSICQQSTVTEWILNLLDPSTAGRGGTIIFIDLVSTNILLAMLGFPLSKKKDADFCFKPSWLFLFSTALRRHCYLWKEGGLKLLSPKSHADYIHKPSRLFFIFPKDTLSVSFTFTGKVQQCLVTGSKWNIFVTDPVLKSTCTHCDVMCSLCAICNVELSQHFANIKKVISKCEILQTHRNMQLCYTFCYKLVRR